MSIQNPTFDKKKMHVQNIFFEESQAKYRLNFSNISKRHE